MIKQFYRLCVQKLMYDIRIQLNKKSHSLYERRDCFTFGIPPPLRNFDEKYIKESIILKEHIESFIKQQHLEQN